MTPPAAVLSTEPHFSVRPLEEWRADADCRRLGIPTEVFFPDDRNEVAVAAVRRICAGCPVRVPCLEFAVASLSEGLWAGTTEEDRRRIRRRRRAEKTNEQRVRGQRDAF